VLYCVCKPKSEKIGVDDLSIYKAKLDPVQWLLLSFPNLKILWYRLSY